MKNIILISYDCDDLGDYFSKCSDNIKDFISYKRLEINIDNNHNSNRETIHFNINKYTEDYIVSIFAHGEYNKIIDNNKNDLINIEDAKIYYTNAIVYSGACFSAKELGMEMHRYACKLFYGYDKIFYLNPTFSDTFVELNNFALKELLTNENIDPKELCKRIDKFFDDKMEYLSTYDKAISLIINPMIMHNRESYVIYKDNANYP